MNVHSPESPQHYNEEQDEYIRPAQNRQRAVSSMSTVSASSRRSKESKRLDLTESAKDKKRLNTKADPSKALSEATPAEVALNDSTLENLRTVSIKDADGNTLAEPDRSNPTRYRFERPLDTIRQFNAAAEGTSHRRSSYNSRPMSQYGSEVGGNRRSSYYGAPGGPSPMSPPRARAPQGHGGYYRNSSYGFQGSVMEDAQEGPYYGPRAQAHPRQPLQPYQNGQNGHYPHEAPMAAHAHQQSYETMTSGSDENSKSTNPSSLNSSFDQLHQIHKPNGHGHQQQYPPSAYPNDTNFSPVSPPKPYDAYGRNRGYGTPDVNQMGVPGTLQHGPAPPAKEYRANNPRVPIKLDSGSSAGAPPLKRVDSDEGGKRKSWLKRKFSKKQRD